MRPAIDLTVKVTVHGAESAEHAALLVKSTLDDSIVIDTKEIYATFSGGEPIYRAPQEVAA